MNKVRKFMAGAIPSAIVLAVLGILFILFPDKIEGALKIILFAALLLLAGGYFILYLRDEKRFDPRNGNLTVALFCIVAAVFIFLRWDLLTGLVQYGLALVVTLSGIKKVQTSFALRHADEEHWYLALIAALIGIAFGVVMLFWSPTFIFRLIGAGFLFSALTDLCAGVWLSAVMRRRRKEEEKRKAEEEAAAAVAAATEEAD